MDRKLKKEEEKLLKKLKSFLFENGQERDLPKIAKIFQKLASIYHNLNGDKAFYVQSVILYNAALLRDYSISVEVNKDICRLFALVLKKAGSKDKTFDFLSFSTKQKTRIERFRDNTRILLSKLIMIPNETNGIDVKSMEERKIVEVQAVQRTVTANYISVLEDVADACYQCLGKSPCKFAIIGLDELAQSEITPYSACEFAFVLPKGILYRNDNIKVRDYFHWLSTLMTMVLANLGETRLMPKTAFCFKNTSSQNNHEPSFIDSITKEGISYRGPLSIPMLLSSDMPIMEMLKLFNNPKNLSKIACRFITTEKLTNTCFIYGDKQTYICYVNTVCDRIRQKNNEIPSDDLAKIIQTKLNMVDVLECLGSGIVEEPRIEIRHVITTATKTLIYSMKMMFNLVSASCYDIITELLEHNHISDIYAHHLRYFVSVATEVRLKLSVYNRHRVPEEKVTYLSDKEMQEIFDAVGKTSLIEYFWQAWNLHNDISERLKNGDRSKFDVNSGNFANRGYLVFAKTSFFLRLYDDCIKHCSTQLKRKGGDALYYMYLHLLGSSCESIGKYESAVRHYKELVRLLEEQKASCFEISYVLVKIGRCAVVLNSPLEAITSLTRAHSIFETLHPVNYEHYIKCTLHLAECYMHGEKAEEVMTLFKKHQLGYKDLKCKNQTYTVRTRIVIGQCMKSIGRESQAISELKGALDLARKYAVDIPTDPLVAEALNALGSCYLDFKRPEEAWPYLEINLNIEENVNLYPPYLRCLQCATWLSSIGACLHELNRCDKAITYLKRAIELRRAGPAELHPEPYIARDFDRIASILYSNNDKINALETWNEIRLMEKEILVNDPCDYILPKAFHDIGIVLKGFGMWNEATKHFQKEKMIFDTMPKKKLPKIRDINASFIGAERYTDERLTSLDVPQTQWIDPRSQSKRYEMIASNRMELGVCAKHKREFKTAIDLYKKALRTFKKSARHYSRRTAISVKQCVGGMGECLMKMKRFHEAMKLFNKAIDLAKETSENPGCDRELFRYLEGLKLCYENLGKDFDCPPFTPLVSHVLDDLGN